MRFIACASVGSEARTSDRGTDMTGVGEMTRTWWIDEEKLAGSPNSTEDELRSLRSKGFVSIICLLDRTEQAPKYDPDVAEKMGYSWHCIPIRDFAAPNPDQFQEFQRLGEQALPKGKILVHCQGGSGRTGTQARLANGIRYAPRQAGSLAANRAAHSPDLGCVSPLPP